MKHIAQVVCIHVVLAVTIISGTTAAQPPAYEGRGLFVSYCQLCHGADGKGDGALARAMKIEITDLTTTVRSRSDTILTKIISGKGQPTISGRARHNLINEAIPEWKDLFDETQVKSLIAYLRFLSRSKHKLMGDPQVGLKLYHKYCRVCHGEEGDGDGIMINLLGKPPMDHTNSIETNRLSNADIVKSITQGKGRFMPAWKGILSRSDIEGLVSYIRLLSH